MRMKGPSLEDMADALDHASDFIEDSGLDAGDFILEPTRMMPTSQLWEYDDLSAWLQYDAGELRELGATERYDELVALRGKHFADAAARWAKTPSTMPPVIVIDTPEFTGIADGRGRVNFAIGMGIARIPVAVLRGSAAIRNPLALSDYHDYCQLVADAYDRAPLVDEDEVWRWKKLATHVNRFYKRMLSDIDVEFVPGQPYESADQMRREVKKTGVLYISTDFNEHPIFTPLQNLKFRAVHDYIVHILPGEGGPDFSERGEMRAYNLHRRLAPPDTWPALFTEVAAQACYNETQKHFPVQKIAVLPFDYYDVGSELRYAANGQALRGYKVMRVERGRLVSGANSRLRFPARKGSVLTMPGQGVFLSPNRQYVLTYYSGLADDEVLLTLDFRPEDIVWGNLTDREPEVGVRRAKVVAIEPLES